VLLLLTSLIGLVIGQCPFGQTPFNGACYAMSPSRDQWFDAETMCERSGGFLTSVANSFERSTIMSVVSGSGIVTANYIWIGANRLGDGINWLWADGTTFTFQEWRPGYPIADPQANCLSMDSQTGLYMNIDCILAQYYVCKFPQVVGPTTTPPPTVTPFCDLTESNQFYTLWYMDYSPTGRGNATNFNDLQRAVIHGHQATVNLRPDGPSMFRMSAVARIFGPLNTEEDFFNDPLDISANIVTFDLFQAVFQGGSAVLNVGAALKYLVTNPIDPFLIPPTAVPVIVIIATTVVNDPGDAIPAANTLKTMPNPYNIVVLAVNQEVANSAVQIANDPSSVIVHNGNANDTIKWLADKHCQFFVNGKKKKSENRPVKLY